MTPWVSAINMDKCTSLMVLLTRWDGAMILMRTEEAKKLAKDISFFIPIDPPFSGNVRYVASNDEYNVEE